MTDSKAQKKIKTASFIIFIFLCFYILLAVFSQSFLGFHSPLFREKSSIYRTKGAQDIHNIIFIFNNYSSYQSRPKNAAELKQQLVTLGKKNPIAQEQIDKIIPLQQQQDKFLNEYILDVADFVPIEKVINVSNDQGTRKISLKNKGKNCKTEKILYVLTPKQTGQFMVCKHNTIYLISSL